MQEYYRAGSQGGVAGALTTGATPVQSTNPIPASWNIGTFHHGNPIYMQGKPEGAHGQGGSGSLY